MTNQIKCPKCGEEIEVSKALSATVREQVEKRLTEKIFKEAELKFKFEAAEESKVLKEELVFKSKKLDEAREAERFLRQDKLKLEDEKRTFELEKQKQMDIEREKIRQQTLLEASDTHRLKDLEKEKIINDLKKSLDDAQLKASQSSQQLQGEVQELDLESYLQTSFPRDEINPVGKGVRGADISQIVRTNLGTICGVILWESKRTKAWVDDWAVKLKDDLRASKANVPVIISSVLPKEIKSGFGFFQGVWVAEPRYIQPLAEILRKNLIDVAREKHNGQDRGTKADMIYTYLTSDAFVQQIQSIIEVHQNMQLQIQKERAAFEKIWKEREAQAARIIMSTAGIYGSIQGVAGQSMPPVKGLDLLEG
ncbi:hypothetical protein AUJ42_02695 [Candidatus Collierbacteria bacterium CG1_02_44_10]|uniref:DUF2130 domain-containing protein n=2 Tax=Candidatus Collieribacteriota TaxID=1752725 RepID=A0A2M8BXF7_9BACT|nr:MAG: hypothetical protein AUJ42_02695 [Candidatus Collierbacteria bacterium CG1_02_44_10]PIZ24893.1 MAG: DUF2130 domain-containing protein [Candidatus Collierbacteria bacterium CG_4_10_14_0_8_um_filter_43_86]PJB48536.1 MAG: DUF2130 domain-containing protein [Candidatus Collierbacteria bacterium CG_4_9_14_3_um_filter_43_16]